MGSKLKATKAERAEAVEVYLASSIQGAYTRLKQEFKGIDYKDVTTIDDFLEAGEAFRAAIDQIRKQIQEIQ